MNYGIRCHRCDIRGADPNVTAVTLNGVSQQEAARAHLDNFHALRQLNTYEKFFE